MEKDKQEKKVKREKSKYERMEFGFKIMAAILAIIMLIAWAATLIFSLIY